jgi:hypothetical protein
MGRVLRFQTEEDRYEEKRRELQAVADELKKKWQCCPECLGVDTVHAVVAEGIRSDRADLIPQIWCECGEVLDWGEEVVCLPSGKSKSRKSKRFR